MLNHIGRAAAAFATLIFLAGCASAAESTPPAAPAAATPTLPPALDQVLEQNRDLRIQLYVVQQLLSEYEQRAWTAEDDAKRLRLVYKAQTLFPKPAAKGSTP